MSNQAVTLRLAPITPPGSSSQELLNKLAKAAALNALPEFSMIPTAAAMARSEQMGWTSPNYSRA